MQTFQCEICGEEYPDELLEAGWCVNCDADPKCPRCGDPYDGFGDEGDFCDGCDEAASMDREERDDFFMDFADPGGNSALRAATASNPRNLPCPTCGGPDLLTPADRACGYQCDACADRDERGGY